jgi:hypothetical protein
VGVSRLWRRDVLMVGESFLSDAGWVFFAVWAALVAAVSLAAFGRDIAPTKVGRDSEDLP